MRGVSMTEKITLTMGGLVPRTVTIEIERPLTGADHAIVSTELIGILTRHFERDMGAIRVGDSEDNAVDAALVEVVELRYEVTLWKQTARVAIERGAEVYGRALRAARAFWRKRDAVRRERNR